MKTRYVLQVGMLALGLVLAAANGATANHGFNSVEGACLGQFNGVHLAIDASGASPRDVTRLKEKKLTDAVTKLNKGKDEDSIQKLQDIAKKVDGLLAARKQKIDPAGAETLKNAVDAAITCIIEL